MKTQRGTATKRDAKKSENEEKTALKNTILEESSVSSDRSDKKTNENGRVAIGWNVTPGGKIDFGRMREATKAQLRELISDPEVARAVGANAPASVERDVNVIAPESCKMIYKMLGRVQCMLFAKKMNVSTSFAAEYLDYTPDELEMLAGPTAKVINKRVPTWMVKYEDEIALCMMITAISAAKIEVFREAAKHHNLKVIQGGKNKSNTPEAQENVEKVDEFNVADNNRA